MLKGKIASMAASRLFQYGAAFGLTICSSLASSVPSVKPDVSEIGTPFQTDVWSGEEAKVHPSLREQVACSKHIVSAKLKNVRYFHGSSLYEGRDIKNSNITSGFRMIYGAFEINDVLKSSTMKPKQEIIIELPFPEFYLERKWGFDKPKGVDFAGREKWLMPFFEKENVFFLEERKELSLLQLSGEFTEVGFFPFSVSYWDGITPAEGQKNVAQEIIEQKGKNTSSACKKYVARYLKTHRLFAL
ncbi:hypothetical protein FNU76_18980 [Chitinimonas arctica]|uniref:Uncharacterized protein n=1 Tax=Chitinimonas arctica TaxID=2594795 RepID=A0A516SJD0_9NEIS|nr:hypothetical protein [Chitinimonas arctica]QDQ28265.1 hypothetical protein FNU76_18980 [Chitinimonas arctica]